MKLEDTVSMMKSSDYKERLRAEFYQLHIRSTGLKKMLEKYQKGTLEFTPTCSYNLLHKQYVFMKEYENILRERAKIEGVDLS